MDSPFLDTPDGEQAIQTLLPHSLEAERGLLCSFMLDSKMVGARCAEKAISPKHFYLPAHQVIFSELMNFWTNGKEIDLITLPNAMRDAGDLEEAGGIAHVTEIATYISTAWLALDYIEIIIGKHILRSIITTSNQSRELAYAHCEDPAALAMDTASQMGLIAAGAPEIKVPLTPKEIIVQASIRAEERIEKRGLPDNVMRTGIRQLDEAMNGMRSGDFVLVSGKEKSGKTSLAFNIMENVVFEQKKRAIAISLEMKIPEIADRMIASMGRINFTNILNGWMSDDESQRFVRASTRIAEGKFQIRDDVFSLPQIIASLRQYKAGNADLELGIVDYLQLVDGDKVSKDDSREQIIAKTSRTLRRAASELNIAILLLVQLNEDGQVRESRAPGMDCTAHVRIEPGDAEGEKWARVVYQRNGPSNVGIPLTHIGQFLRFEQGVKREEPSESTSKKSRRNWHTD